MIIIVEGPDGAGKTHLTRQLQARFNLRYAHEGPPPADIPTLEHYGSILQTARGEIKQNGVVFDRLALGERVYGPIYRNHDSLGELGWRVFTRLIYASVTFQVMCLPSYDVCHRSWASGRDEMIKDEETFRKTYDAFDNLSHATKQNYIYDWTHLGGFQKLCRAVEDWFGVRQPIPIGMVGSPFAHYLLVGDRGSNPNSKTTDLAFFGITGSSGYLMKALDQAGFSEAELMWVNAVRHDGIKAIWTLPGVVIALGDVASHECKKRFIEHKKIPHPQYWKRFRGSKFGDYVEKLKECR